MSEDHNMVANLFSLEGQVIVVTGGAGLLGQKHIQAIASAGGKAIMLDVSEEAISKAMDAISKELRRNVSSYVADITSEKSIDNTVTNILADHGKITGLVNNAAINPKVEGSDKDAGKVEFSRLEHFPVEQWHMELDVGLKGAFLCTKHMGAAMVKGGQGGVIINVCSDLGLIAPDQRLYEQPGLRPDQQPVKPVTYSVIKSGLIGLSRYVSTYWNQYNIRCNALCPGGVENGQPEEFMEKVQSRIPMGRMAQKNEYQGTLIWMLSDASSYLNGAVISVDGGRTTW